jgi:hypothetical protein
MTPARFRLVPAAALGLVLGLAVTASAQPPPLAVKDAWVRPAPAGQANTGAFMIIENLTASEVVIAGGETPTAKVLELHEMRDDNGIMRMRKIEKLVVPAKGTVVLKPGGHHIMLIGVTQPLEPGAPVTLTLKLADGTAVKVDAKVRPLS